MISFIIAFASKGDNLYQWKNTDSSMITFSTILAIKNINKVFSDIEKEIILVDNTNTFPNVEMPNLKIVKGLQYKKESDITTEERQKYNIKDVENHTMWASTAYNIGIEHAKGNYIVLQHNDIFYHKNLISSVIDLLNTNEYVTIDYKKIGLIGYLMNKEVFHDLGIKEKVGYEDGGYVKTKSMGMADAYFFACKKSFFDDYIVDYEYGDTNHGATIKCLQHRKNFLHLKPYYENPNFTSPNTTDRDYYLHNELFITHLKGGFSEHKLSFWEDADLHIHPYKKDNITESIGYQTMRYLIRLNDTL